ncbi:hypothetical protein EG68_00767 [Paragonimus skrjabini miyazakii]|uniref:Uncharacterized protein n=1 Tax=Paragonimus skrjabini miyazakii TaxID=59628 RepID=A0A8S9Z396_9TREM|nr:hypothetical protein EG68_00767 [Paragonimus skrjabini miyazakii]
MFVHFDESGIGGHILILLICRSIGVLFELDANQDMTSCTDCRFRRFVWVTRQSTFVGKASFTCYVCTDCYEPRRLSRSESKSGCLWCLLLRAIMKGIVHHTTLLRPWF